MSSKQLVSSKRTWFGLISNRKEFTSHTSRALPKSSCNAAKEPSAPCRNYNFGRKNRFGTGQRDALRLPMTMCTSQNRFTVPPWTTCGSESCPQFSKSLKTGLDQWNLLPDWQKSHYLFLHKNSAIQCLYISNF